MLAALLAVGFAVFLLAIPERFAGTPRADGIVALTGETTRLNPAIALLEHGGGKRLLITGVNPLTTKNQLRRLLKGGLTFDCCVDLGFRAADTRGNAQEAAAWAALHRYTSLVVVTADYHMPRSLLEFSLAMPKVRLIPYAVAPDQAERPWPRKIPRLLYEYAKYVAAGARALVVTAQRRMTQAPS